MSAAVCFNIGNCHMHLQNHEDAVAAYEECLTKDKYFAIAYFQLGCALTHMKKLASAIEKFEACIEALRGNPHIDYRQLGMKHKFYACEAKLNLALVHLFNGSVQDAQICLEEAVTLPRDENKHFFINSALDALSVENWDYFDDSPLHRFVHLPSSCLFYPSKAKMDGLKTKSKFMESAQVVSATDDTYSFVGFVGPRKLQRGRQGDGNVSPSPKNSGVPPPLPTVAPPRQFSNSPVRLSPISQPTPVHLPIPSKPPSFAPPKQLSNSPAKSGAIDQPLPVYPPMPSKPPPVLASKHSRPVSPNFKRPVILPSSTGTSGNGITADASSLANTAANYKQALKPVKRPPPPSKQSIKSNLNCHLTVKLLVPKNKITTYTELLEQLARSFEALSQELRANPCAAGVTLHSNDKKQSASTVVSDATWKNTFINAVKENALDLSVDASRLFQKQEVKLSDEKISFQGPQGVEESVYTDEVHAQQHNTSTADTFREGEEEMYATTVMPAYKVWS